MRYKPFGETAWSSLTETPTQRRYTGQIQDFDDTNMQLYFYNARYYDPELARFTQADTIVPEPGNPQTLNRFSYVKNNPLKYIDPTGHFSEPDLVNWFGQEQVDIWKLDDRWWQILLAAEFGDFIAVFPFLPTGASGYFVEDEDGRPIILLNFSVADLEFSVGGVISLTDWNINYSCEAYYCYTDALPIQSAEDYAFLAAEVAYLFDLTAMVTQLVANGLLIVNPPVGVVLYPFFSATATVASVHAAFLVTLSDILGGHIGVNIAELDIYVGQDSLVAWGSLYAGRFFRTPISAMFLDTVIAGYDLGRLIGPIPAWELHLSPKGLYFIPY